MVSIAPNQFQIEGVVVSKTKDAQLDDFVSLLVKLSSVVHVEGPAGFLNSNAKELQVQADRVVAQALVKGVRIRCRVRKTPNAFFLIPDSLTVEEE